MSININQQQDYIFLIPEINQHLSALLKNEWFEIDYWQQQDAVIGQAVGRNITWFIGDQDDQWVLRHYYRGGLIAKLSDDKYFFSNIKQTRCYQELMLLEQIYKLGLPVPKPIAARVFQRGLLYQADILVEKIRQTHDLVKHLQISPLSEENWQSLGAMIAKFHHAGIYHSDLNAHNILIDKQQQFWLIDFDKCDQRAVNNNWQNKNLQRLLRSFEKEKGLHPTFYFEKMHWNWLLQGYQNRSLC